MQLPKFIEAILRPREPVDIKTLSTAVNVLQDNPAYQHAREEILRDIVEQWLGSAPDAIGIRERLYLQAHALSQVDTQFSVVLAKNAMKDKQNAG